MIDRPVFTGVQLLPYLLGLVALLTLWMIFRLRRARLADIDARADSLSDTAKMRSPYHAVSVRVGPTACMAAKAIEGQRFLAAEAPQLPLAECSDNERCQCRFIHHEDRRSGRDRRSPFTPGSVGSGTGRMLQERRQGGDRRQGDRRQEEDVG